MKKLFMSVLVAMVSTMMITFPAVAKQLLVFEKPLNLFFVATQGGAFSLIDKDKYDTEKGFNSALMNLFVEGDYTPLNNLKFYASSMLTVDWIYQLKTNDSSWHDKLFSDSSRLNVDDKYWQLLKEAHVTWTPKDFLFRVGKQIVKWGETDGFRLMDQINPGDGRRGFSDVEFETSVIPIWLIRTEYYPDIKSSWLTDLGLEFIFNPNADFIADQRIRTGNDVGGIWAPDAMAGQAHVGSIFENIREPDKWTEGQEFAFRVKGVVSNTFLTLNYFYGRDNSPVLRSAPIAPKISMASDGRLILHPFQNGFYPRFRYAGATLAKDITPLKASFLGGVAPVIRMEAFYAFNNTFVDKKNTLFESDEFRWSIGVDWKVKIPVLNPMNYFSISPQFYHRCLMDYPEAEMGSLKKNNYQATLSISTSYLHNRLIPSLFVLHDVNSKSNQFRLQLFYDYSTQLRFTLGTIFLHGDNKEKYKQFQLFDHKDYIFFKVAYKWG